MGILTPSQELLVREFEDFVFDDDKTELVITGSPGTGKSFMVQHLIGLYKKLVKLDQIISKKVDDEFSDRDPILLTATTHKAARVLSDFTQMPASTIHSALGLRVFTDYRTGDLKISRTDNSVVISNALIVIDECSMANDALIKIIRSQICNSKIIWVGDQHQLKPVKSRPVNLFDDAVTNSEVVVCELTETVRQAKHNPIISLASKVKEVIQSEGAEIPVIESEEPHIQVLDRGDFLQKIREHFSGDPDIDHARIVVWRNTHVVNYNELVHKKIRGAQEYFEPNDIVISADMIDTGAYQQTRSIAANTEDMLRLDQVSNSRELTFGDYPVSFNVWEATNITRGTKVNLLVPQSRAVAEKVLKSLKSEKNWFSYYALKNSMADLRHPYAITAHKAQGSTYDVVFIDLQDIFTNKNYEEIKRLLYVAITRARDKIYIYKG